MFTTIRMSTDSWIKHWYVRLLVNGLLAGLLLSIILHYGIYQSPFRAPKQILLLNSGLSKATEAKAELILWFPQRPPENLLNELPPGWNWRQVQTNGATVSGTRVIQKNQEEAFLTLYQTLARQTADAGGQAYLDERIHEGLDLYRFFSSMQAQPLQWAMSGSTLSLTGYIPQLTNPIVAGSDRVNLQLLTRSSTGHAESVMAIPVLLNEF
ncbi:MAG: hypothetical protein ACYCVD_11905 [Desulfitobacteriaceae bacterium]